MNIPESEPLFPTLREGVIGGVPQLVCDARELHASLRPGTRFAQWLKHRIASLGLREGFDYAPAGILPNHRNNSRGRGRPFQSTLFTAEAAKLVAAAERNSIGNLILRYFVRCEDELSRIAPEHPLAPAYEGVDHLQADRQSASGADPARPHQD